MPSLAVSHLALVSGGYMPTLLFQILAVLGLLAALMLAVLAPLAVWRGVTRSIPQRALRLRIRLRLLVALEGLALTSAAWSGVLLAAGTRVQLSLVVLGSVTGVISLVCNFRGWLALQEAVHQEDRPEDMPRHGQ